MESERPLRIGITCYASVGGSGVLASALGQQLANRGHEVHFISSERPFRWLEGGQRLHFHPVTVREYGLFKYPDYTLPLSVKMAEVSRACELDVLHVHYAVPHATAAILARDMLRDDGAGRVPKIVTTLHGTDTTLLGQDAGYRPAIRHALSKSDAVTAVSEYLRRETLRVMPISGEIDVIHNFYTPRVPRRLREEVRRELGVAPGDAMLLHISNLRPVKRIDLLLETAARVAKVTPFKLVILAGEDFGPFAAMVQELGLENHIVVRDKVMDIEDYIAAADLGLYTSISESFCLSILEGMFLGCPSVATRVGGIPEVISDGKTGVLVDFGDADGLARAVCGLLADAERRAAMGTAGRVDAQRRFSTDLIVSQYEQLYRRLLASP